MNKEQISFIGAGNLAWHLAPALDNAGFKVAEVYSRDITHAKKLTERLYDARVVATLDFSESQSTVFFIAIQDDAIESVAREIILPEYSTVVHTSGSQPLSILDYLPTDNTGVFYPLQTFTKNRLIEFDKIPVCLESSTREAKLILETLAGGITGNVCYVNSADRKVVHVAAVFACNFVNHLFTISKQLLNRNGLDFDLLIPLISETINKSLALGPERGQTGPARRGDLSVIEDHIQHLSHDDKLSELYRNLSEHIIVTYSPKD